MTAGKYRTVLQNEKCMNDAILSVLANLHRAARKKNDYIWSPYKFDSLKSIWGDDSEMKTNKIDSEASGDEKHAKTSLTLKDIDLNIQRNAVEMQDSCCEKETEELSFQVDCKVPEEKSDEYVFRKWQETFKSIHKGIFESYHQNHSELKTLSDQKSLESRPELINDRQNQPELSKDISRSPVQYGAPNMRSFSKENSLPKETNVVESVSCEEFDDTRTRRVDNGLIHHLPQNVLTMTETSYPGKDSTSFDYDNDGTKSKLSPISKPRRRQKSSEQFTNIMSIAKQDALSSKRNRDDTDSSTGSLVKPLQKKIPGKTKDINQNCGDKEDIFFRTLLSVKVVQDDQFYEITLKKEEFDRVRKKYPQLGEEVLPDTDTFEKEVPYCAGAVKIIIGYLFHPPFDFSAMPDGRTSVEILAATRTWAIQRFHDNFQLHFVKKITESNFRVIYSLARHFDLHQICNACKVFLPEGESIRNRRSYKPRKCFIAVSRYLEPLELCIPLGPAEQLLNDNFDRDIRNIVVFEAITKDFNVAGFQIILDASNSNINESSATLDIFYSTKLMNSSADPEEIKLSRPFRPNIAINFKRKVVVKKHEKMQISVETTIKPYLCFETYENLIKASNDAEFSLTVESTYRVNNKSGGKRFIIGKLLYNPIDEA